MQCEFVELGCFEVKELKTWKEGIIRLRGDALKYWKWPPYRNCTIHEHQQKMQILTYTSNNVKYI